MSPFKAEITFDSRLSQGVLTLKQYGGRKRRIAHHIRIAESRAKLRRAAFLKLLAIETARYIKAEPFFIVFEKCHRPALLWVAIAQYSLHHRTEQCKDMLY